MKPEYSPASQYGISRSDISPSAIKVIETLTTAGFLAYLVGGGIRDLLLGQPPKDFDISTNARPEEVIKLFRKARIIGRRFRIAHVYFGREIIEVTTFRGHHPESAEDHPHAVRSATGQLLRDNIYGSLEEDALRRDFTINSLYYELEHNQILDYTNALSDIKNRVLRIIGDPGQRYREDPVRMLRAIRFAAKLEFDIEQKSAAPISELANLLNNIPAARLFDEVLKLFLSGHGIRTFDLMRQYQLFEHLFPGTKGHLKNEHYLKLFTIALSNTDDRIAQKKGITPAFILAVFLWPSLQNTLQRLAATNMPKAAALHKAEREVISRQVECTAIPRRFSLPMREIWSLQFRLDKRNGQRANKLLAHPRFRAAYDFLLLREHSGESGTELVDGLGQWWTEYQEVDTAQRKKMVDILSGGKLPHRRRRRPQKKAHQH